MNEQPEGGNRKPPHIVSSKDIVLHYYIGMSGPNNYLTYCGLTLPKNDLHSDVVRLDWDISEACNGVNKRHTERKKVVCEPCGLRGALVSLGNIEL